MPGREYPNSPATLANLEAVEADVSDLDTRVTSTEEVLEEADTATIWIPDLPPETRSQWDDEFDGSELDEKWSSWDVASVLDIADLDTQRQCLVLEGEGSSLDYQWAGLYQAIPGSEFAVYCKMYPVVDNNSSISGGLFLANSHLPVFPGTADFMTQSFQFDITAGAPEARRENWSAYNESSGTPVSSSPLGQNPALAAFPYYFRMRVNAQNVACDYSVDGRIWFPTAVAATSFVPVYFGLCADFGNGAVGRVEVIYFRVFEGAGSSDFNANHIGRLAKIIPVT